MFVIVDLEMVVAIGEYMAPGMDICSAENAVIPLRLMNKGMDSLLVLFIPHCFGDNSTKNTLLSLIKEINDNIDIFRQRSIRVVGISRSYNLLSAYHQMIVCNKPKYIIHNHQRIAQYNKTLDGRIELKH